MTLDFLQSLDENRLLRLKKISDFDAKDMSDLAMLYILTLHILRSEFETAPMAMRYAQRTITHGNFDQPDPQNTDLYQFLYALRDHNGSVGAGLKNPDANRLFWHEVHFNGNTAKQLLSTMAKSTYDSHTVARLLLNLEQQLHVTNSNYRSVRRLASDWTNGKLDTHQKRLTVTRLLQALRARARRGDLTATLEELARESDYELHGVANAETGKSDDDAPTAQVKRTGGFSLLKGLAIAAGLAAANQIIRKARA